MADINLLQGSSRPPSGNISMPTSATSHRSGTGLLVFLLIVVLLEAAAYGGLWYYRKNTEQKIQDTETQIADVDTRIATRQAEIDTAVSAQARLVTFDRLLDDHVHWSRAWDELAAKTVTIARYVTLEADTETNQFRVTGIVFTFSDLGKLLLGLEQSEWFSDISFDRAVLEESGGISFEITVEFNPTLLTLTTNQTEGDN
jgi:Tfp pilus assembly protein PilN